MKIPNRLLKLLFPALLLTEAILVWTHVLDAGTAVAIGAAVESLTFLLGLRQIVVAFLRYRRSRAAGFDAQTALEEGLTVIFPRRIARIVAVEPRIWICLYQWAKRRPLAATEFSYGKRSIFGALLAFVLITAPFEVLAYEILLPWATVRLMLLLATIYMALWMIGLYASLKVMPYKLEADGVRLHYGIMAAGYIPYSEIAKIWIKQEQTRDSREGLAVKGDSAYLAAGGRTDLTLRLHNPRTLNGLLSPTVPVTYIHLVADQPDALARALAERAGLKANNPPPAPPALGNLAAAMLCVCVLPFPTVIIAIASNNAHPCARANNISLLEACCVT